MAHDIETYLRELQAAMVSAGADPALVQDALFDAEEYMQAAMGVGGKAGRGTATYENRLDAAVQGYGTPEEVAAAYLGTPVGTAPGAAAGAVREAADASTAPIAPMAPAPPVPPTPPVPPAEPAAGVAATTPPEEETIPSLEVDSRPLETTVSTTPATADTPIPAKSGAAPPLAEAPPVSEAMAEAPAWAEAGVAAEVAAAAETPPPGAVPGAAGVPAAPHAPGQPYEQVPQYMPAQPSDAGYQYPPGYQYPQQQYAPVPPGQIPAGVAAGMAAAAAAPVAAAPPSVWRDIFGVFVDPAVWKALVYMIISLATGIVYFTIVVTGISMSFGMLVMIIGIPLLVAVLGLVRAMSLFEGRLVELLLGTRMPRRLRSTPPDMGFFQRIGFWLKDGRTWASMVYMILMLPLGIAYFTVAVTGLSVGVWAVTSPIWGWFRWHDYMTFTHNDVIYYWWHPWMIPISVVVGVAVLVGMFHLIKWIGRGHAAFAKAMLVRLAE